MPEKPYEEHECRHPHKLNIRGEWWCQNCGMRYNETTLTWEEVE
jgi:hypothetical protein